MSDQLSDRARSVIDANRYMALGTADEAGHPWVTPVWFASEDYRHFHWVSSPDAKHSRYLAAHPEVAITIFDSSVPVGGAQAVYMKAWPRSSPGRSSRAASKSSTACPERTSTGDGDSKTSRSRRSSGSIARRSRSTSC